MLSSSISSDVAWAAIRPFLAEAGLAAKVVCMLKSPNYLPALFSASVGQIGRQLRFQELCVISGKWFRGGRNSLLSQVQRRNIAGKILMISTGLDSGQPLSPVGENT